MPVGQGGGRFFRGCRSRKRPAADFVRCAGRRAVWFFFDFTSSILAKVLVRCYLSGMELLEKLETQVAALLARLDRLRAENERISAESAVLGEEKAALEDENHRLREALENEEQLRAHALKRIDAVLRNIQEHDSVE